MKRRFTPFLCFAAALAIGYAGGRIGLGEDSQNQRLAPVPEEMPATVEPVPQPSQSVVVPDRPVAGYRGYSISAFVPLRSVRRGPLAAYAGAYVAPRYVSVYAGHLAPWGSVPARFYAAGVPLPLRAVQPAGYLEPAGSSATPAREAFLQAPTESYLPPPPEPQPPRFNAPAMEPESAGVETIPTPSPMDSRPGGLINRPTIMPQAKEHAAASGKPASGIDSHAPSGEGPREF